jgi:hypothetical protein
MQFWPSFPVKSGKMKGLHCMVGQVLQSATLEQDERMQEKNALVVRQHPP